MRAHSLALSVAVVIGVFALFATSAEAGGKRHKYYRGDNCYRGGGGYGYYQPNYRNYGYRPYYRNYYRPVRYYQPVFYPTFQIGFGFGGGGYCR